MVEPSDSQPGHIVYRLTIPGRPVTWQRTKSYKGRRITPKKYRVYKRTVGLVAKCSGIPQFGTSDIAIRLVVRLENRSGQGDLDNYSKAVCDGLQGVLFDDDRQVVEIHARFVFGEGEGMDIEIWETTC